MTTRVELELQIVLYAHQQVTKGRLVECLDMGFDLEALRIIRNLDLTALPRCDSRRQPGIMAGIMIDNQALARLAAQLDRTAMLESVIDQLLERGASSTLLKHYFGINRQEIYGRRKLLGLPPSSRGRRTRGITTRSEERLVLQRLDKILQDYGEQERSTAQVQCQSLLQLAATSGHCVNEIWEVAEKHDRRGTFAWHGRDRLAQNCSN